MKSTRCLVLLLLYILTLNSLTPINAIESSVPATPGMSMLGIDTLPAPHTENRRKRKVSELVSSHGALEYMTELRNRLSDNDGRPTFEHEDDPTSVWCIRDRGNYDIVLFTFSSALLIISVHTLPLESATSRDHINSSACVSDHGWYYYTKLAEA